MAATKKKVVTKKEEVIPRAKRHIVAISVDLEVITPDRLKKMIFGFSKKVSGDTTNWDIAFQLFTREKKSDKWGDPLVKLKVKVDSKHNELAEETATKGMNRPQVRHAITRSGPAAEKLKAGKTSENLAKKQIEGVVPARKKG